MIDDAELLRRYADDGSEAAFTELVTRNVDLVYAAALRHLADEHRAKDIAQTVFVDLARKARALRNHPALASWLFTSTRYAALKALRSERRRQIREHEAHLMQHVSSFDPTPDWERLRPVLDEVMDTLGASDREVLVLRYFRGLPFAELAGQLKVNEGALRMRVDRALDKMSALLAKRGISSTATALGLALGSQPLVAAPVGLAASVSGVAVATATTAASGLGTLLIMSKTKIALVSLVLCGGIATAIVEHNRSRATQATLTALDRLARENAALRTQTTSLLQEAGELRRQQAELTQNAARNASAPTPPTAPSAATFDGPLGNLKLLAEATKRGLVAPARYFSPSGPFVPQEPFVKAFALKPEEVATLKAHMAQAQSKINALTVANATAAKGEDGNLIITIKPSPDGTSVYNSLLEAYRETLGPERYTYFAQLAGDQFEQSLGYFGAQGKTITLKRNPTGAGAFTFKEDNKAVNSSSGGWGSSGPVATRQQLEERYRMFAHLIPADF